MRKLRDFSKMNQVNDGTRTLFESVVAREVIDALRDWKRAGGGGVVIGGTALSYHARPRATQDVDILFLSDADIPSGVDARHIRLMTSQSIPVPADVIRQVIVTATVSDGISVATPSGLVALKLFRQSMQDKADIVALIKTGKVDVSGFSLPPDKIAAYVALVSAASSDLHPS